MCVSWDQSWRRHAAQIILGETRDYRKLSRRWQLFPIALANAPELGPPFPCIQINVQPRKFWFMMWTILMRQLVDKLLIKSKSKLNYF
ncbi:MAG: hypothetical protein EBQ86_05020 [Betaproteobacteria bacterium]|jgi:hypothetical protein|nr:hypothetical protein [Betaproteobacteria bacterium]